MKLQFVQLEKFQQRSGLNEGDAQNLRLVEFGRNICQTRFLNECCR
jgi:hypothetical protein